MPFLRVRGATPGDPAHVFDVSVDEVEASPDLYVVVDAEPVDLPRPVEYVEPVKAPAKPKPARKRAPRPAAPKTPPAPAVEKPGTTKKETA